jgi:hypothetical protein
MTGDQTVHVSVSYEFGGAEITRIYAVGQHLLTAPRPSAGRELKKWLADKGYPLDSSEGPALKIRSAGGSIVIEEYYCKGKLHRQDGPAHVRHDSDGATFEAYYRDGKLHRDGGPATINRRADRSTMKEYYQGGELHREDGPAVIARKADGSTMYAAVFP